MFERVLVGLDGSEPSERCLPWVRWMAPGSETILARAVESTYNAQAVPKEFFSEQERRAREYLTLKAREFTPEAKIEVRVGPAASILLGLSDSLGADLICLSTRGGSALMRRVVGGTTEKVLRGSEVPVLVVPSETPAPPSTALRRILVPLDGSDLSEMILPFARRLAENYRATAVLTHILSSSEDANRNYSDLDARWANIAAELDAGGVPTHLAIRRGSAPQEICDIARSEHADMIVMSAHWYGSVKRMIFGSVAGEVIRLSEVPVLVARYRALRRWSGAVTSSGTIRRGVS